MSRNTGTIDGNKTYLIVVEGKTEHQYFSQIKSSKKLCNITIKLKKSKHPQHGYILNTVSEGAKNKETPYESIWCVYDCDTISHDEMLKWREKLKKGGINVADSLPSFEIWFLLHYTMPKKSYNNQDKLIEELKKYFPTYKIGMSNIYTRLEKTSGTFDIAMTNSRKLAKRNKEDSSEGASFCNVYKIFEELEIVK